MPPVLSCFLAFLLSSQSSTHTSHLPSAARNTVFTSPLPSHISPHIYPLFSSTKLFLRFHVLTFSRFNALALLCSPCPRSAQYFLHNKSALTSHCTTAHSPALSYKTTVHKSAPTPLHASRNLRNYPPLCPCISIFSPTFIHFHTVQIKYFLHFSTFLAFLRSYILPAIHALTHHIFFLHSRVVPLCCPHALHAMHRVTETYHLGDTIFHIPRWFPVPSPIFPCPPVFPVPVPVTVSPYGY